MLLTMPVPLSTTTWTTQHHLWMTTLKDWGWDVYEITNYFIAEMGGPKEWEVVLHKMQVEYFRQRCGVDIDEL
jgi:hypothetical protein